MLKNLTLKLRTNSALKKNKRLQGAVPFKEANRIAILVQDLKKDSKEFTLWLNDLNKLGKKTEVIHFAKNADIVNDDRITNITNKSIDWKGKIKDDFIENFIKTEYDYLFSLHTSSFLPFENILARTKAKCRVGQYIENKEIFFDIMIQPNGSSLKQRTEQLLEITKHI